MKIILRGIMKGLYKYSLATTFIYGIIKSAEVISESQGFKAIGYFFLALFFLAVFIILLIWIGGLEDDK